MEHDYREENHRLNGVTETAPFPIGVYVGHDLKIEMANAKMIETFGKGSDVIGKSYAEILPELEHQEIFEQLRGVLATGVPFHARNKRVDIIIDGTLKKHYFNYSFTPLLDTNGNIYGVMNTGADVTDLNIARQQTTESDEKLRMALNAAGLGIYEIDLVSGQITTSGNFNTIWDIDDPVTQDGILSRLHPDDLHIREQAHRNVDRAGRICYDIRIIHRNNAVRWLKINGKFITDSTGARVSLMGIVQDITDAKQFAEQLEHLVRQRTADLERSNEDLMQFAHVINHDLKEPVRKIMMFNGIIENEYAGNTEGRGMLYLKKVKAATDRMATMIDGVLNYSTINASGYPAEKVNLNSIIENIKTDLELVIDEKKAILILDELPEVEGSPILLHQLFYNLINNALKFSRADVPPRVIVSAEVKGINDEDYVLITVSDNGIGFEDIYTDKIFNVFERLHSKDAFDGTGLGLALCKKIVERHNGQLSAKGSLNVGADFTVTLPLFQSSEKL